MDEFLESAFGSGLKVVAVYGQSPLARLYGVWATRRAMREWYDRFVLTFGLPPDMSFDRSGRLAGPPAGDEDVRPDAVVIGSD